MKFIILGELCDLNNYILAERSNKHAGAKIKRDMTEYCQWQVKWLRPIKGCNKIIFTWYCKNKMKDPDGISFAKKFILDGLVAAKILENDGWKQIKGFEDRFEIAKNNPHIDVEFICE